jgi:HPt (histidine-containing phosphotransfer) domain-containing protein
MLHKWIGPDTHGRDEEKKDLPGQIRSLKDALEKKHRSEAYRHSHTIKGAAANVGAAALSRMAWQMEKDGKTGDLDRMSALLPEIEKQFGLLRKVLPGISWFEHFSDTPKASDTHQQAGT